MVEYRETIVIEVDRSRVWMAINDPGILESCIPGCQEFSGTSEDGYSARVTLKIGPVKATFNGTVQLEDVVDGTSCTIIGEGQGGVAGFAKGSAKVKLVDATEGTEMTYEVDARVGGKIARLGSRLIKGSAKKIADEFFQRLRDELTDSGHPEDEGVQVVDSVTAHSQ
ncbi:MAG: carbon monoxide dehydrogenase subunit G [Rhodobacteraceae bacterium]|nr:carbon monoxide dehydrogenase subunit G [Paracoccaceae bacterium]MCY4196644.1 carbon monoxide dehydrogenase subunit G [Paracoccaceae bacterium]MCY4326299.1 carbon monoxide dehydrogenase subunit G [Paracoccaceae bacterium]